jgi:hypothetical protein
LRTIFFLSLFTETKKHQKSIAAKKEKQNQGSYSRIDHEKDIL